VGYLGDGINDAPALKAADVGISVHNAVDVARESADMILMAKGLDVLSAGITEGRKTYLNTLKYIFITISANFGNMLSMAVASVFLPFLPLLPAQVLLTNFLSDIPALTIASDQVDEELLTRPRRWDNRLIKRFMIVFGLESSFFDLMSFGVLIWIFAAPPAMFRTAWFVESVITEILILLIIRTHRMVFRSRIGTALWVASIVAVTAILVIPYLPGMTSLGFSPLPAPVLGVMLLIAAVYAVFAEITKRWLFRKMDF
jgi:Mg2+-importing ATPase